jgi:hypothetical protein
VLHCIVVIKYSVVKRCKMTETCLVGELCRDEVMEASVVKNLGR